MKDFSRLDVWRKCPPLVLLTRVISILLYVNDVYLHSRAVREERGEERREERREERALLPHALRSYISESRVQYIQVVRRADSVRTRRTGS